MEARNYFVYEHVTPDGMYYFGISRNLKKRFEGGSSYKGTSLKPHIDKWGWKNIQHNVLMRELTYEEAKRTEDMLILTGWEDGVCINETRSGLITSDKNEYVRNWSKENPEKCMVKQQTYRKNHHEKYLETSRKYNMRWRENNREHSRKYQRDYMRKYRENKKQQKQLEELGYIPLF